ncbi:glycosyltransferase family 4 protein [Paenibacillus herberti]|uniref:Glycosyl transferase n=1 Tax=Paenibacillus herberti TaxID=1619309 RepID=A0A229NUY2_9BACL|nr:glycosyltransferase family 4 protein [Paenibacillus herberti]OXM13717.1 hypothetical protein CGZ75_22120 [Paenibacillus herberti]
MKENILVVNHAAQTGGAERVLLNWLTQVAKDRFQVKVVLLAEGPLADSIKELGFDVQIIPSGRIRHPQALMKTISSLRHMIRQHEIQKVISWSPKPHMYAGLAAWLESIPAMWWQHGVPANTMFDKVISRIPAQAVLCPSEIVSAAQSRVRANPRTVVRYPGIVMEQFQLNPQVRALTRRELGIESDTYVFAFIGRLQKWKRADVVIEAFYSSLRDRNAHLLIIGGSLFGVEEELEEELKKITLERGIADNVHFLGHQSSIEPFLWASDAVVHSSINEPFGMVVVEAMASGRLVLAVNSGGPSEIITHEADGLLYDGSSAQLAGLMSDVLDRPNHYANVAKNGIKTVNDRFSASVMAGGIEKIVLA